MFEKTTAKSADSIIYPTNKIIENMDLTLNLNSRLQPMHRHDLEDALQEILEKINLGEVMGGGTLQNPQTGEIESCDIEIH